MQGEWVLCCWGYGLRYVCCTWLFHLTDLDLGDPGKYMRDTQQEDESPVDAPAPPLPPSHPCLPLHIGAFISTRTIIGSASTQGPKQPGSCRRHPPHLFLRGLHSSDCFEALDHGPPSAHCASYPPALSLRTGHQASPPLPWKTHDFSASS